MEDCLFVSRTTLKIFVLLVAVFFWPILPTYGRVESKLSVHPHPVYQSTDRQTNTTCTIDRGAFLLFDTLYWSNRAELLPYRVKQGKHRASRLDILQEASPFVR